MCVLFFCVTCFWFAFHFCGQALEEEILNHSKDLFQAVSLGQMLRTVSSVDDKEFVQSKLDAAQASYIELQERCRRKAEMLQQALSNAQLFGEDEVALMNWLSEVHTRLSEVSVEECKIDVLENQLAEQRVHNSPPAKHQCCLFYLSCFSLISLCFSYFYHASVTVKTFLASRLNFVRLYFPFRRCKVTLR